MHFFLNFYLKVFNVILTPPFFDMVLASYGVLGGAIDGARSQAYEDMLGSAKKDLS